MAELALTAAPQGAPPAPPAPPPAPTVAELDIDQSHLPLVNEVRQSFAVREDGVLAHSLQEQEIEQYYSSNVQKSQLVQRDIRVAKRLQGEEELQRRQHRALLQHTSRQLEEQDGEYARLIQEELRRCAEETRRREQEDEEIAKRIQEEEELRGRGPERLSDGSTLPPVQPRDGCLDLGTLRQVLQDEELARRLQEEEEEKEEEEQEEERQRVRRRRSRGDVGETSRTLSCHEEDFRVAQVAQDEEIARFMQKQEIKSRRRSRDLDGPTAWGEHREAAGHRETRVSRETASPPLPGQRERRDSDDPPSPAEEQRPPGAPVSSTMKTPQTRNIAEELDPTFRARPPGEDALRSGQTGPSCQSAGPPEKEKEREREEEPGFVPPTKRPSDKSAKSAKPKEKKETCKQQ